MKWILFSWCALGRIDVEWIYVYREKKVEVVMREIQKRTHHAWETKRNTSIRLHTPW